MIDFIWQIVVIIAVLVVILLFLIAFAGSADIRRTISKPGDKKRRGIFK